MRQLLDFLNSPALMKIQQHLQQHLDDRHQASLYRVRLTLDSPQDPVTRVDGETLMNFCSNDYLGLANHPRLVESMRRGARDYGVGSGASHLVVGHSAAHEQLELALADFTGCDRALLFGSGYMANMGVLTALLGKGDYVYQDRLNHASLLDGGLLCGARFQRFPHNDLDILDAARLGDLLSAEQCLADGGRCARVWRVGRAWSR